MFQKYLENKKEIKKFKEDYSNGVIKTEVIFNLLQPFHSDKNPLIKSYTDYFFPVYDSKKGTLEEQKTNNIQMRHLTYLSLEFFEQALNDNLGKCDFKFSGNRDYNMYVLSFKDCIFIGASKPEIVISEGNPLDLVPIMIAFDLTKIQFTMNYLFDNFNQLHQETQTELNDLKKHGILDSNHQLILPKELQEVMSSDVEKQNTEKNKKI